MPERTAPFRILVLCTGNSARSQMAEAIIATRGLKRPAGKIEAASAGSRPASKVNDNARDACPFFPGAAAQVHWGLPDPAEHIAPATARAAFSATYQALVERVNALLRLPLETLDAAELKATAQEIHDQLLAPVRRSSARLRRPT